MKNLTFLLPVLIAGLMTCGCAELPGLGYGEVVTCPNSPNNAVIMFVNGSAVEAYATGSTHGDLYSECEKRSDWMEEWADDHPGQSVQVPAVIVQYEDDYVRIDEDGDGEYEDVYTYKITTVNDWNAPAVKMAR